MKTVVNYRHLDTDNKSIKTDVLDFEYNDSTTFKDLSCYLEKPYLVIHNMDSFNEDSITYGLFGYIHTDTEVLWNVPVEEVKIKDFINTYNDNCIYVSFFDGLGAADGETIKMVLDNVANIIQYLYTFASITVTTYELVKIIKQVKKYIKKKFSKDSTIIKPLSYFASVLIYNNWNIMNFSKKYHLSIDDSKIILEILGYKYNKKTRLYHITDKQKKITVESIKRIYIELDKEYIIN